MSRNLFIWNKQKADKAPRLHEDRLAVIPVVHHEALGQADHHHDDLLEADTVDLLHLVVVPANAHAQQEAVVDQAVEMVEGVRLPDLLEDVAVAVAEDVVVARCQRSTLLNLLTKTQ